MIAALVHLGEFRFQVKPDSEQAEQGAEKDGNDPEIELENFDEIIAAELLGTVLISTFVCAMIVYISSSSTTTRAGSG